MIINLNNYVDRYLNDYIFYHGSHFAQDAQDVSDAEMASYVFGGRYQEELETAALGQIAQASMFNSGDNQTAATTIDVADQISNGTLLQETLDEIAESVNLAIDQKASQIEFDKLYKAGLSYQNLLSRGIPTYSSVHGFLQLLTYALDQGGGYNESFLRELRWFGRTVTGRKRFNFNPGNARLVSQDQLANLTRIQQALTRAAEKFQQTGGKLSTASFRSTLVFIFKRVIADTIVVNLVGQTLQQGEKQINDILVALGFKPQQGTAKGSNINDKVYIVNTNALGISIAQHNTTTTIEIGTNLQVNLAGTASSGNNTVVLATGTIGDMFTPGTPARYYAYNIMSHRHQFSDQYNALRGSIAANFLKDATISHGKQQTAQFLMYNGKVYPVYSIIKNICDEFMRNGAQSMPGIMIQELARGSNAWFPPGSAPSRGYALIRSNMTNAIINKLTISINYNTNILGKYIK